MHVASSSGVAALWNANSTSPLCTATGRENFLLLPPAVNVPCVSPCLLRFICRGYLYRFSPLFQFPTRRREKKKKKEKRCTTWNLISSHCHQVGLSRVVDHAPAIPRVRISRALGSSLFLDRIKNDWRLESWRI